MTHIHVVLWNKVPISSVCLTVVAAPRNRFIVIYYIYCYLVLFSVSNCPDLTGHRYTTKAKSSTSKSHWDQGTHTLCNLLSCMVAPALLGCL